MAVNAKWSASSAATQPSSADSMIPLVAPGTNCRSLGYSPALRDSGFQKLQLLQVVHDLRAGPVNRQDKLAANDAVAINDGRFRITCGSIQVVAVFG
jgi:hypothetical protein